MAGRAGRTRPRTLRDAIPDCALRSETLESLDARYVSRDGAGDAAVWFEDMTPAELEVIFPTTDAKLNYLSRTQRLASLLTYARHIKAPDGPAAPHTQDAACVHGELLARKRERFAAVINRFLDLHQILRG
ncbi:DNA packaging protein UL33 [Chimpanzee herpesvirus strain 105640]|uniref:DNA packaging protein UL33 n=1 Tax=Chimpanzee herpesvirus strain 105640 TaxID=332937 RepID=K9MG31_9ALPH|nr:DNA packaging protein UL33 [Chimpanzee herpesvirus strain 105640]AFV26922.1 DNA packaging protein UL33 [Chimpanzee herpesvirus strain 105640]